MDEARMKTKEEQKAKLLLELVQLYEESLESKVVILFRKLEEIIAYSQVPLTHINLVLDMLKAKCVEMSIDAYVNRGSEKIPKAGAENG